MKATTAGLTLLFFALTAHSCIWITGTKFNSKSVSTSGRAGARLLRYYLQKDKKPDGVHMEASLRGATNFNDRSDYSVALMYLGRSPAAVEMLQQLEKEKPGQYFIAANLGTAYELSGNNEEALRWINEGLRRDPDSHEGTEWLHAKILEAKIAQQKDPNFFKNHSVLELQPQTVGEAVSIGQQTIGSAVDETLRSQNRLEKNQAIRILWFDWGGLPRPALHSLQARHIRDLEP